MDDQAENDSLTQVFHGASLYQAFKNQTSLYSPEWKAALEKAAGVLMRPSFGLLDNLGPGSRGSAADDFQKAVAPVKQVFERDYRAGFEALKTMPWINNKGFRVIIEEPELSGRGPEEPQYTVEIEELMRYGDNLDFQRLRLLQIKITDKGVTMQSGRTRLDDGSSGNASGWLRPASAGDTFGAVGAWIQSSSPEHIGYLTNSGGRTHSPYVMDL